MTGERPTYSAWPADPDRPAEPPRAAYSAWPPDPGPPAIGGPYDPGGTRRAGWSETERGRGFGGPSGEHRDVEATVRRPPDRYPPNRPRPARRGWPVIPVVVTVAVLALAAGGYFVYVRSHHAATPTPTPVAATPPVGVAGTDSGTDATTDTSGPTNGPTSAPPVDNSQAERDELNQVEKILNESAASRSELLTSLRGAQDCRNLGVALTQANAVTRQRASEEAEARAVNLADVPGGEELRADLVALLHASGEADAAYRDYVLAVHDNGCGAGASASRRGDALSQDAQVAKTRFFTVWTPLAEQFGLTPHSNDDV